MRHPCVLPQCDHCCPHQPHLSHPVTTTVTTIITGVGQHHHVLLPPPTSHGHHRHSPATTTCYHHYWHCHRHSGCDEDLQLHQDVTNFTRSIYPWACYLTCQFPHLQRGRGKSVYFTRLLGGFKELVCGRRSEESLAHDEAKYIGCHTTPLCATATINARPIPIARTIWSPSSPWWSPSAPHHNPTVPSAALAPERRTRTSRVPSPRLKSMHWWPHSRVTGTPLGYPLISHGALGGHRCPLQRHLQ